MAGGGGKGGGPSALEPWLVPYLRAWCSATWMAAGAAAQPLEANRRATRSSIRGNSAWAGVGVGGSVGDSDRERAARNGQGELIGTCRPRILS